jgi:hypothetical protein
VKSAHAPSASVGLSPLTGERAKGRRRLLGLALLILLAGAALLAFLLSRSPSGTGPGVGGSTPSASLRQHYTSSKGWSMRYANGMHVEHSAGSGISYGVDEVTFASFRSNHGVVVRSFMDGESIRTVPARALHGGFPAGGIAVRVLWQAGPGFVQDPATRLPLRLSSFRPTGSFRFYDFYAGTHPRPLQHLLVSKWHQRYFVQVWIGPKASARQRALLGRIVSSIAVRPPRVQS